ncbi:hydroxyisourate hydrolase [Streptomyces polyrhachis]|uniref:5-hydroxyisourate hydrolase n=1 Tax=Streptomyces polyrhachis TaxID=1282885 RepID=A0ABW2GJE5_9ACTN
MNARPQPPAGHSGVSTHILDTSAGRPAAGVPVTLSAAADGRWETVGSARTDADGRCAGLPQPPAGTTHVRLVFDTGPYLQSDRLPAGERAFFPEVTVAFAVEPGEHYHVPLLLNPFGYSVYRGS